MPIEGRLKELSIQDVLQLLELTSKTGVLTVRSEQRSDEAVILVENGALIQGSRRRAQRLLGQQLLRVGKLTEGELERALALQAQQPSDRLGSILLEMGSVDEEELTRQLRFQIEETVYDVLAWEEGYFTFEEQQHEDGRGPKVPVRVESLLMEGARRIDEWARLESRIAGPEAVPVLAPGAAGTGPPLDLHPDEWQVLAEVDGDRDIRDIAGQLGLSTFDVAKIIYGLASMDVVRVEEHAAQLPERELNAALEEIQGLLEAGNVEAAEHRALELQPLYPDRAELPFLAGRALAAQGRMRAATESLKRAVTLDPLSAAAHYELGLSAIRIGELERAARALDTYLRLTPAQEQKLHMEEALNAVRRLNQILAMVGG